MQSVTTTVWFKALIMTALPLRAENATEKMTLVRNGEQASMVQVFAILDAH